MSEQILLAVIGFLAIGHALFLSTCLFSIKSHHSFSNKMLGLFLLALAIRISKSVITIVFPESSDLFIGFGLAGLTAIGPWLLLYLKSIEHQELPIVSYVHLLPASLILLNVPFLKEPWLYYVYIFGTIHLGIYLVLSFWIRRIKLSSISFTKNYQFWTQKLILGTGLIWLLFIVQIIFDLYLSYVIATSVAVVVLYGLSFYAFKHNKVFNGRKRASKTGELQSIANLIEQLFNDQKIYRTQELTVHKLGSHLGIKSYLISQAINDSFNKSLPELINQYRLKEVCHKLESRTSAHLSIEAIASDAGFNALSTFYTSFKKTYTVTPTEYRRQCMDVTQD